MSRRGDFVTFHSPIEGVRAALSGSFTVADREGSEIEVRDELEKLVCRISVMVVAGPSWWLTLQPLKGYDADVDRMRRRLLATGMMTEEDWKQAHVPMRAEERADVAVARVLLRLLEMQEANLPGALADADIEFLHDYRVAVRRTRSVLREMPGVFTPDDLERVRAAFKWLQDQTSAARDLDVYLDDYDHLRSLAPEAMRDDLGPLQGLLGARRLRAHSAMEAALSGERALRLRAEWREILLVHVLEDEDQRPDAARPIAELTAERVRKVHRKMVKMGRAIDRTSAPEQYHELRKKGKELRYLLELFAAPLFDAEVVRPIVTALKGLQDVLGLHQDREVQIGMLKEIGGELVAVPGGPGALMAIGALIERLEADAGAARERFAASFAKFASEAQCKLVAEAFNT